MAQKGDTVTPVDMENVAKIAKDIASKAEDDASIEQTAKQAAQQAVKEIADANAVPAPGGSVPPKASVTVGTPTTTVPNSTSVMVSFATAGGPVSSVMITTRTGPSLVNGLVKREVASVTAACMCV